MNGQKSTHCKAVIFGAGEAGLAAYDSLKSDYDIIAFVDNDHAKHHTMINEIVVISADDLLQSAAQKVLIASEYSEQIIKQLEALHITQDVEVLASCYLSKIDFSQPENREQATQVLLALCECMNKMDLRYYVDAGTLLGIIRDDALIPWDDDLDLALHASDVAIFEIVLPDIIAALESKLSATYQVSKYMTKHAFGAVPKGAIRSFKLAPTDPQSSLPKIDIFIKYVGGEHMDYCLASRGIRMPSVHFNARCEYTFRQAIIRVPYLHEAYLQEHYGDWQTPKPEWSLHELENATLF